MKRNNLIYILTTVIAVINYLLYLKFLVLNEMIYFKLILASAFLTLILFIIFKFQKIFSVFIFIIMLIYCSYFSLLYIKNNNMLPDENIVAINGFYTRRIDGVLFTFRNKNFDRPISKINNKVLNDNILNNYKLKLNLVKCTDDIYLVSSLKIIPK